MSWDFDKGEMWEAVKEGDADLLWAGYQKVCVERDQARSVATVARDLVETIRSRRASDAAITAKLEHLGQVVDGIKPIDWEAVAHLNAESWAKLGSKYRLALELLHETRVALDKSDSMLDFVCKHDVDSDMHRFLLSPAYEAIAALVDGFTQLTKPGFDAWPVRLSTSMILKPHMCAIDAALAYKGRDRG